MRSTQSKKSQSQPTVLSQTALHQISGGCHNNPFHKPKPSIIPKPKPWPPITIHGLPNFNDKC